MTIEEFVRLGERIRMREELANAHMKQKEPPKIHQGSVRLLSDTDALFIQKEFEKDVLERDWTRLYEILNHLKSLSNSLIVHEIKLS